MRLDLADPGRIVRSRSQHLLHGCALSGTGRADSSDRPPATNDDERLAARFDASRTSAKFRAASVALTLFMRSDYQIEARGKPRPQLPDRRPTTIGRVERYDVAVIGAGPAGSVTAIHLARGGARVLLVDKASFPRTSRAAGV